MLTRRLGLFASYEVLSTIQGGRAPGRHQRRLSQTLRSTGPSSKSQTRVTWRCPSSRAEPPLVGQLLLPRVALLMVASPGLGEVGS